MKAAFFSLMILTGCATGSPEPFKISELRKHPELAGRVVLLNGWLFCENAKCALYQSSDFVRWMRDAENVQRSAARQNLDSFVIPKMPSDTARIDLGRFRENSPFALEVAALPHEMTHATLEVRMIYVRTMPPCYEGGMDQIICGGRGSEAEPIKILNVIQSVVLPSRQGS